MGGQIRAPLTLLYSTNECVVKKTTKNQIQKGAEFIMQKGHNTAIINSEKENRISANTDQIRFQCEYEQQNKEEISTVPSVNDLLEQPLQNETSEDDLMRDQRDRSRSHRERNTGERQGEQSNHENETITRNTRPTRGIRPIHLREM